MQLFNTSRTSSSMRRAQRVVVMLVVLMLAGGQAGLAVGWVGWGYAGFDGRVAQAAQAEREAVCEVGPADLPAADSAITPLRRQPFEGTSSAPAQLSYDAARKQLTLSAGRVTLPELKAALDTQVPTQTAVLEQTAPKVWLLRANLTIGAQAALTVDAPTATWLRIESSPIVTPALALTTYGYLQFKDTKVTSWDSGQNAVDAQVNDGRAYLLAYKGGRMDLYGSEAAYLGYHDGEHSGLSWRKCADEADATTGATGDIHDSDIHHNYFGMYSYQAYGIWAKNSQMHHNHEYGFDPHDYSDFFIFEDNSVFENGKHGIIFSRECEYNIIRNNTVRNNADHGIMLDRRTNFNQVLGNQVFGNQDGIAVFQSTDNILRGNHVYTNLTGIRVNATPVPPVNGVPDRTEDQPALRNQVLENTIENNTNYGVYLYNRADETTIAGNTISGNGRRDGEPGVAYGSGIQIKTGANTIGPNNTIADNGHGISLLEVDGQGELAGTGDEPGALVRAMPAVNNEPGRPSGSLNTLRENRIRQNKGRGVRLVGAGVGVNQNTLERNEIDHNGDEGLYLDAGNDNQIVDNHIHHNGAPGATGDEGVPSLGSYGVNIKGFTTAADGAQLPSARNVLRENRIYASGREAIKLGTGVNGGLRAPLLVEVQVQQLSGTAQPQATVEVFRDLKAGCGVEVCGDEAAEYVGTTQADGTGAWTLAVVTDGAFNYAATQRDAQGNSSELSHERTPPTISIGLGRKGEQSIFVSGSGAQVTIRDVQIGLQQLGQGNLLTEDGAIEGRQTWTLHASLFLSPTVTLWVQGGAKGTTNGAQVDWLRLRSVPAAVPPDPANPMYDYNAFATLKAYNGNIFIEDSRVTSWDTQNNRLDETYEDGRSFVLAKYESDLTIINSDMSYLGYPDGEAYGVSWRDTNPSNSPPEAPRITRVTGQVINSSFSHNYYGIYTFQARDMLFRGNQLFSNVQYGFDPHDFTHDVLVENNRAYDNGSHGFIISRGCSNFVFRGNQSYENRVKPGSKNPSAHGFMLDPGAPPEKSGVPQVPSTNNLIEGNLAYGNDGYAMRVYGSNQNIIRDNQFYSNRTGITLEAGSTGNHVLGNTIRDHTGLLKDDGTLSQGYGVYALQGADGNTIVANTVSGNAATGIYLKTGANLVQENIVSGNGSDGVGTLLESAPDPDDPPPQTLAPLRSFAPGAALGDSEPGIWSARAVTLPAGNQILSNTLSTNLRNGVSLKGASATSVVGNTLSANGAEGLYLASGTSGTLAVTNVISGNQAYGIKVNGADVIGNLLSLNIVTANGSGGIAVTNGANGGIAAPRLWLHDDGHISGTSVPGALIELFSDGAAQAAYFEGSVLVDAAGEFTFTPSAPLRGSYVTATATGAGGNTSALSKVARPAGAPEYEVFLPLVVGQPNI